MTLSQIQKDLIIGTLLGDGHLQTFSNGSSCRYRALHSATQKDYLFHKYEILKSLCGEETGPAYLKFYDERTKKYYQRWSFNTLTDSSLLFFRNLFYKFDQKTQKWKKQLPNNIETFLTPRAIAYWYMDDGSLKFLGNSNAMRISTDSFSGEEINRLINAFQNKYNLKLTRHKSGFAYAKPDLYGLRPLESFKQSLKIISGRRPEKKRELKDGTIQYTLYIPEDSSNAFRELIKPYLIDSLKFKVSDGNSGHL